MSSSNETRPLLQATGDARPGPVGNAKAQTVTVRPSPLDISRSARHGILAGLILGAFVSVLNLTLVPTMLPTISSQFNKAHQASWLGTSYLLSTCTFTPLYGRLCDALGRRGASQLAVTLTGLGVLAAGFSNSMELLVVARFISGMGGAGVRVACTIVISDMYSLRSRGLVQSVLSMFIGIAMGIGGPMGGLITDLFGWRWAFLVQIPAFILSFVLISHNLTYVTVGQGKNIGSIAKRIDYGGTFLLLTTVASVLVLLSARYNEGRNWSDPAVYIPLILCVLLFLCFLITEIYIAPKPVLEPSLLRQKIPVLVGMSNLMVAMCNFSVTYFFPMWFQTVAMTSASIAGLHLMPNTLSMSLGSVFAGWMMHRTGSYKTINLTFGIFPFIGALLVTQIKEDSGWWQKWFSIVPLGFGNAVVLQTVLIALIAHLPHSMMAIGTGFGELFRGVGQVMGVAISSSIFQYTLSRELRNRIHGPDSENVIERIRHSTEIVATLPYPLQRAARDAYAVSLHAVFVFACVSTLLSYIVRLPIPDQELESTPRGARAENEDEDQ